jgi:hypothetical protein
MRVVYVIALSALVAGCNGGIDGVSLDTTAPASLAVGNNLDFTVTGKGTCGQFSVDWGDGSAFQVSNYDFGTPYHTSHRYDGWGGGKTVTVTPVSSCSGYAQTRFKIEPSQPLSLGWSRGPSDPVALCNVWPNANPLASHSLLHVTGDPSPQFNFSCGNNGCIFDPDGLPGSVAAAPFPFPGMREFSLVIKVPAPGNIQLFQGGKNANVTVPLGGHLEVCQNTFDPKSALGGWGLYVRVDELGPGP